MRVSFAVQTDGQPSLGKGRMFSMERCPCVGELVVIHGVSWCVTGVASSFGDAGWNYHVTVALGPNHAGESHTLEYDGKVDT